jgi:hypothetical protein
MSKMIISLGDSSELWEKILVFVSFSQETSWQNSGHRKWPLWRTLAKVKWPKNKIFSGNFLVKWWSSEVATLGTLPETKSPKNTFCQETS